MPVPEKSGLPPKSGMARLFVPLLPGATLRSRLLGSIGILLCLIFAGLLSSWLFDHATQYVFLIAPVGASAVLLFVIPSSPMAQPWPIIGGNTISALVGVLVSLWVAEPLWAAGLAVSLAVVAMSLTRSMHPPGGAIALSVVIGGQAITDAGFYFPLTPVALDSALVVLFGLFFHKICRRPYPHYAPVVNQHQTQDLPTQMRGGPTIEDVDAALASMDESFDIRREDLQAILRQAEMHSVMRHNDGDLAGDDCASIMSRDIVMVKADDDSLYARDLLLKHNIRSLPVIDGDKNLLGTVGLRELLKGSGRVENLMAAAPTALPESSALSLLPVLTNGRSHAVIIVNEDNRVMGLISQTDLLAALARMMPPQEAKKL